MFKALKDARRRSVETILGVVGSTERTVDADYDEFSGRFLGMMDDMVDNGKALQDLLEKQKAMTADASTLAETLARVYSKNAEQPWPTSSNGMTQGAAAEVYKDAWADIHSQIRSGIQAVQSDHGLEPIRNCVQQLKPEFESAAKVRAQSVVDYDSYRRRLKNLQDKQQLNRQQGKDVGNAAAEMKAEIERYEAKKTSSENSYKDQNEKLKSKINQAKSMHDTLMDDFLINAIVTQAELYSRAAKKLQEVVDLLPQDRVIKVKAQIETMFDPSQPRRRPSVLPVPAAELGASASTFFSRSTDNQPSAVAAPKTPVVVQSQVPFSSSTTNNPPPPPSPVQTSSGNPFGEPEVKSSTVATPSVKSASKKLPVVTALYDHVPDADDELEFFVGDKVEVIEQGDGGWWTGRCHGKTGLFPVNYVDASDLA